MATRGLLLLCLVPLLVSVFGMGCSPSGGLEFTSDPTLGAGGNLPTSGAYGDDNTSGLTGVSSAVVGSEGGTLIDADGSELAIPPGALTQPVRVTLRDAETVPESTTHTVVGAVKSLEPDGQLFMAPLTLDLPVTDAPADRAVRVATYDTAAGQWVEVPGARAVVNRVTAPIIHFSTYAAVVRNDGDPEGGRLVGKVTDGVYALAGAVVEITAGPTNEVIGRSTTAGEAGGYELEGLPTGEYTVCASTDGHESQTAMGLSIESGVTRRYDFVLTREGPGHGSIVGQVTTVEGAPIHEARVEVVHGPDGTIGRYRHTDADGIYELVELPAGTYALRVTREGFESKTEDGIEVTADEAAEQSFVLQEADGDGDEGESDTGRIVGHVRNGEEQPIREAKVEIIGGPSRVGEYVYTLEGGAYELEGLTPGTYALRASHPSYESKAEDGIPVEAGGTTEQNFVLTAAGGDGGGDDGGEDGGDDGGDDDGGDLA